jgi:hypothetical protein
MKYLHILKQSLFAVAIVFASNCFISCSDDIVVGTVDEASYQSANEVYSYVKNYDSPLIQRVIEIHGDQATAQLYIGLTKAALFGVDVKLKVDESVLNAYNEKNGTAYEMFPVDLVTLEEAGAVLIAPGVTKSQPVTITVKKSGVLQVGKTYVLPLAIESVTDGVKLSAGSENYMYFVKVLDKIPDNRKSTGIVTICYIEVNEGNPLNVAEYTLKNSGKQLVDIVNLFAANINFSAENGRVYVYMNDNIQHLLKNRDKYIKPLQDKGIKVCLSILGNHDQSGVANLSDNAAHDFVAELKNIVETYGLDGIDFDDEWSSYVTSGNVSPGLTLPSAKQFSRLVYEAKKAMPDKLITVYHIGYTGFTSDVDGMAPGSFIDYSYYAYYGSYNTSGLTTYKGMTTKQWGPFPVQLTNLTTASSSYVNNMAKLRAADYGVMLLYDMRALDYTPIFNSIATTLYDDEIVYSGKLYTKDY